MKNKLYDIQILRGIAIFLVLAHHLSLTRTLFEYFPKNPEMGCWIGVELFFVISGYVVTMSFFRRKNPMSVKTFVLKRIFRLYPAMVAFLLISGVALSVIQFFPVPEWGKENLGGSYSQFFSEGLAVLFGKFINIEGRTLYSNGAMWSLSVEFQFYAFYGFLALVIGVLGMKKNAAKKFVLSVFAVMFILIQCSRYNVDLLFTASPLFHYLSVWRFDFLCVGVMVYFAKNHSGQNTERTKETFFSTPVLLGIPIFLAMHSEDLLSASKPFMETVTLIISSIAFSILVYRSGNGLIFPSAKNSLRAVLLWAGNRSYSIYLIHYPVMSLAWCLISLAWPILFSMPPIMYGIVQLILVLPVTFLLSEMIYRFIEQPLIQIGNEILNERDSPTLKTENKQEVEELASL